MSINGFSEYKKASHRRKNSGELDVFEAARYFSGYNDTHAPPGDEEMVIKEDKKGYLRVGRASLDMPSLKHHQSYYNTYDHHASHAAMQQPEQQQQQKQQKQAQMIKEKKKFKQPSSPGGKLANFLNSIFTQTMTSRKKKLSTKSMKDDEDESPGGRRRRRFSISHFRSSSSVADAKPIYSSSSSSSVSGFRTPPPYTLITPATKCYKDVTSFSDYKDVLCTLSKQKIQENGHANVKNEKIKGANFDLLLDEKFKLKNGFGEKTTKNYYSNNNNNHGYQEKIKKNDQTKTSDEDGAESDSSSDLFELQIGDSEFEFCSSGLPVYETTRMDSIKRSASTAITNGPIKV